MVVGVVVYSYMIGSLTNILSNVDSVRAKLDKKLEVLSDLAKTYSLNKIFVKKLASSLEYEHSTSRGLLEEILQDLPTTL